MFFSCSEAAARAETEALQEEAARREAELMQQSADLQLAVAAAGEPCDDNDDLFILNSVLPPAQELATDLPQESVQSEAKRLLEAETCAVADLKGAVTVHDSVASVVAVMKDRLAQKGAAHVVSVLVDPVIDSPLTEQTLHELQAGLPPTGAGTGTVVVSVLCGHTVQHLSKVTSSLIREMPEAAVFDTKLVSQLARGVSRYVSCRGLARRGTDEYCLTAVVPAPVVVMQPKKRARKMSMEIPHVLMDMPRKATIEDAVSLKCNGECVFMQNMKPEDRAAQLSMDPVHEGENFHDRLAKMNEQDSSDGSGEEPEPVTSTTVAQGSEAEAEAEQEQPCMQPRVCRVFGFARPKAFYTKVVQQVLQTRPGHTVLIVQSTGSPNAWLAARALGVTDVHVVYVGVSEHQIWHGRSVAHKMFRDERLARMDATMLPDAGSNLQNKLQYIRASRSMHDSEDPFDDPWQVAVSPEEHFAGVDVPRYSVSQITERLVDECSRVGVQVLPSSIESSCKGVFTVNCLEEGCVLAVSALYFSRVGFLKTFLQQEGARRYHDRLVVLQGTTRDGEPQDLYAVLLGYAGELMHSAHQEGKPVTSNPPNVVLEIKPRAGFNRGLLQLTVRTFNGCGVKANGELLLDYGPYFDVAMPFGPREAGVRFILVCMRVGPCM